MTTPLIELMEQYRELHLLIKQQKNELENIRSKINQALTDENYGLVVWPYFDRKLVKK